MIVYKAYSDDADSDDYQALKHQVHPRVYTGYTRAYARMYRSTVGSDVGTDVQPCYSRFRNDHQPHS